ncbi:MAG: hypothetical protein DHS80DRAFT_26402 [Piptocephalis tieghemiana]|nr:MAG: hypothetical protein DHS80DRAFT_26402 [Piptocephalis tieghemiana]
MHALPFTNFLLLVSCVGAIANECNAHDHVPSFDSSPHQEGPSLSRRSPIYTSYASRSSLAGSHYPSRFRLFTTLFQTIQSAWNNRNGAPQNPRNRESLPRYSEEDRSPPYHNDRGEMMDMVKNSRGEPVYPTSVLSEIIDHIEEGSKFPKPMATLVGVHPSEVSTWCFRNHPTLQDASPPTDDGLNPNFHRAVLYSRLCNYLKDPSKVDAKNKYLLLIDVVYARSLVLLHHTFSPPILARQHQDPGYLLRKKDLARLASQLTNAELQLNFPLLFLQRQEQTWKQYAQAHRTSSHASLKSRMEGEPTWRIVKSKHEQLMKILLHPGSDKSTIHDGSEGPSELNLLQGWFSRWADSVDHLGWLVHSILLQNKEATQGMSDWITQSVERMKKTGIEWQVAFLKQHHLLGQGSAFHSREPSQRMPPVSEVRRLQESLILLTAPLTDGLLIHLRGWLMGSKGTSMPRVSELLRRLSQTSSLQVSNKDHRILWSLTSSTTLEYKPNALALQYFIPIREGTIGPSDAGNGSGWQGEEAPMDFQNRLSTLAIQSYFPLEDSLVRQRIDVEAKRYVSDLTKRFPNLMLPWAALHAIHVLGMASLAALDTPSGSSSHPQMTERDVAWVGQAMKHALLLSHSTRNYLRFHSVPQPWIYSYAEEKDMENYLQGLSLSGIEYARSNEGWGLLRAIYSAALKRLSEQSVESMRTILTVRAR